MSDFHIKARRFFKEEEYEKTSIKYVHGAGAVSDAPARASASGGGYAGERRHRAAVGNFARRIRTGWNE